MKFTLKNNKKSAGGFTLIELVISVVIFAFMTTFLLVKYGNFNQSILLTNLAYDVALTIRNAQSYGINVRSAPTSGGVDFSNTFSYPYGVRFGRGPAYRTRMIFFKDSNIPTPNRIYDGVAEDISIYNIKRGSIVSNVCVGNSGTCTVNALLLDITFQRPNPDAIITIDGVGTQTYAYGEITVQSTDGGTRKIIVRSTGQISILD